MTQAQRTTINNPATGLLVWQTDAVQGFYYNSGTPLAPNWTQLGAKGDAGQGVPPGGASGQVLSKVDGNNYNTQWANPIGSASNVISTILTNDVLVNVTSPNYVDGISVNLEAGKKYWLKAYVLTQRAGNSDAYITGRIKYTGSATTPAGILTNSDISFQPGTVFDNAGSFDSEAAGSSIPTSAGIGVKFTYNTIITTNTAGILTIQNARMTTNTTNNFFIKAGTFMTATPL